MLLKYNDLVIRGATEGDSELLAHWWNNGQLMAHVGFPLGLRTTAEKVRGQILQDDEKNRHLIIERAGVAIGEMSYNEAAENVYSIGIKICIPKERNHGNGKRLVYMLTKELLSRGADLVIIGVDSKNVRARHVYEKVGFFPTGEKKPWHDQLGKVCTEICYAISEQDLRDI